MARTTDNASASATSANSSITNVAALANVSIATVSRVLSGKRTKDDDIARGTPQLFGQLCGERVAQHRHQHHRPGDSDRQRPVLRAAA